MFFNLIFDNKRQYKKNVRILENADTMPRVS